MWRHHRQQTSFLSLFGDFFFLKNREFATEYSVFRKSVLPFFGDFSPKAKSLLRSSRTTLQLHPSCKHRLTNRAERGLRRARWW
jgi:hypothetical protein